MKHEETSSELPMLSKGFILTAFYFYHMLGFEGTSNLVLNAFVHAYKKQRISLAVWKYLSTITWPWEKKIYKVNSYCKCFQKKKTMDDLELNQETTCFYWLDYFLTAFLYGLPWFQNLFSIPIWTHPESFTLTQQWIISYQLLKCAIKTRSITLMASGQKDLFCSATTYSYAF